MTIAASARLWVVAVWQLAAIGWARHDDYWFLTTARSIVEGRWLGQYGELTLIKGAGYPLFVAAGASLRLPLLLAQQCFYVLACFAVYAAFAARLQRSARLALFLLLVFNPMSFTNEVASRVTREGIYAALTLFVLAGVAGASFRLGRPLRAVVPWAVLAGLALGVFWNTREEAIWVAPLLGATLALVILWVAGDRRRLPRALVVVSIPAGLALAAHVAIVVTNGLTYGAYTTVEFKEKSFLRAYGSLTSVRQRPMRRRIPVPREVRERVYAVSPAFAELKPYLEGDLGKAWASTSYPEVKDDIGGGWFMWAFREAVSQAGYYDRGPAAVRAYYDRISAEVAAARAAGRLDARRARASMVPALLAGERTSALLHWLDAWKDLVTFARYSSEPMHSSGSDAELLEFAQLTRTPFLPRKERNPVMRVHVAGTITHPPGSVTLRVERQPGRAVAAADVEVTGEASSRRSHFEVSAPAREAWLVIVQNGRELERIRLGYDPPASRGGPVHLAVEEMSIQAVERPQTAVDRFRMRAMQRIAEVYQVLFAPFALLVLVLYLVNVRILFRDEERLGVMILLIGIVASIAARLLILALITVTSFSAMTGPYQSAAHALMIVAVVVAAQEAVAGTRLRRAVA